MIPNPEGRPLYCNADGLASIEKEEAIVMYMLTTAEAYVWFAHCETEEETKVLRC